MEDNKTEYWLRGPVQDIPALLQPVAHALLQANAEIKDFMENFPEGQLWQNPAGLASVGFHLQHIKGVLDRLFTYSKGESLTQSQSDDLRNEGKEINTTSHELVAAIDKQIQSSVDYLKMVNTSMLTEVRTVGRKKLPSTVMGLLFHAAEHTMRHTGQLLVTTKFLNS